MAKDKMLKNAMANYAIEYFEIASYRSLIATAQAAGMEQAGPPWSNRAPGWHLRELIEESGAPPTMFTTVVAQASPPIPELWRRYLQQRFATFDGPFIRAGTDPETWGRICELWHPDSPEYLFTKYFSPLHCFLTLPASQHR